MPFGEGAADGFVRIRHAFELAGVRPAQHPGVPRSHVAGPEQQDAQRCGEVQRGLLGDVTTVGLG
jgi:hypothetical protein